LHTTKPVPAVGVVNTPTSSLFGRPGQIRRETVRPWVGSMHVEAAELLGRLHALPMGLLSPELTALARSSDARQHRVLVGVNAMVARLDDERPGWRTQLRDVAQLVDDLREESSL
jgi:hypothetical protein